MQKIQPLDGIRGCAILAVLAYHSVGYVIPGGHLGVKVFFVLSGFLITSILLGEHARTGRLNLGHFYMRRLLRLGPAIVLALALTAALVAVTPGLREEITVPVWLAFLSTFAYFNNWVSTFALDSTGPLAHTWSLSVEEQFYLLWPPVLILLLAKARANLVKVIAWSIVALSIFRAAMTIYLDESDVSWQFATTSSADQLLVGCLAAVLLHHRPAIRVPSWAVTATFALILVATFTAKTNTLFMDAGFLTVFAVLSGVLVLGVATDQTSPTARLLSVKPLTFVGRISYGLYLYHWPIFLAITSAFPEQTDPHNLVPFAAMTALAWALTFVVATASFFWVEAPILRLKDRFTPPREDATSAAGAPRTHTPARQPLPPPAG